MCDLITDQFIFLHLLEGSECSWEGNRGEEEREERRVEEKRTVGVSGGRGRSGSMDLF